MKKMQTYAIGIFFLNLLCITHGTAANNFKLLLPIKNISKDTQPLGRIYTVVEQKPEFKGGERALFQYLAANIKYPKSAREKNIEGIVYVGFVVEPDGSITEVDIRRGVGGGCSEEAARVIADMPKWTPGREKGKRVRVAFILPIKFKLEDDKKIYTKVEQKADFPNVDTAIYTVVDQKPEYIGGDTTMYKFLAANIKYPEEAIKKKTEGTVYLGFVVNADGSLSTFNIKRGIGNGCDDEALRVIKMMPKWVPGRNKDVAVRTEFTLPIKFKIE